MVTFDNKYNNVVTFDNKYRYNVVTFDNKYKLLYLKEESLFPKLLKYLSQTPPTVFKYFRNLNETCYTWTLWPVDVDDINFVRPHRRVPKLCPFLEILTYPLFPVTKRS